MTLADGSKRPIAFASRTPNKHKKMYLQLDKEGVALIYGGKKFHQYVYGRRFVLETDTKALSRICYSKAAISTLAAATLIRWLVILYRKTG